MSVLLNLNSDALIAFAAALSTFSAIFVVCWPYLFRDRFEGRMKLVADERARIRTRERQRIEPGAQRTVLRPDARGLYKVIVDRFNLSKQAEDGEIAKMLHMAGFRGQGPVVTFLAARLIAPLVLSAVAFVYVFLVLKLQQPLALKVAIATGVGGLGYYAPLLYVRNRITKRQKAVRRAWPDALDLLLICVESGMGIESAFRKVSEEIGSQSIELAEELSLTTAELSYLQNRRKAYENLATRTGVEGVKAVVTSLIQSERYGTPLGQSLRVLAQENRDIRMSEAEKMAAALPPKLTVPMILFFLPVLFAVIVTPAAIQIANLN